MPSEARFDVLTIGNQQPLGITRQLIGLQVHASPTANWLKVVTIQGVWDHRQFKREPSSEQRPP